MESKDGLFVCTKDLELHFIRMEKMNETNDLFQYDLKPVEKINSTAFKVNCEADLSVDLDADYHVS
jgi:hypothetical protein